MLSPSRLALASVVLFVCAPSALAAVAQQQLATFLASAGAVTLDPHGAWPFFETPIAGPPPETLNFIP